MRPTVHTNDSRPPADPSIVITSMRVLIVPDKFQGTLTAKQAATAIARGWKHVRTQDTLDRLPMSDGGDGFGEVMSALLGAKARRVTTVDAAHRSCRARWWWEPESRTAIVESAEVIGLARLPKGRFHPFELDTSGLGRLLEDVAQRKPRITYIGLGGSATNDGGFGLAHALGWRFVNRDGELILSWPNLVSCRSIVPPRHSLSLGRLTVALDVLNPLLGPKGCTHVYGPQKGLQPSDLKPAEAALRQLARMVSTGAPPELATIPGAGAAGGLGFGLMAFLKAKPMPGFSLFAQQAELLNRLRAADLVITGEGCLDQQSRMGKGVGQLAKSCKELHVPCLALVGSVRDTPVSESGFGGVYALNKLTSQSKALKHPAHWLGEAAAQAATAWRPTDGRW